MSSESPFQPELFCDFWGTLSCLMATTLALHSFQSPSAQLCNAGHLHLPPPPPPAHPLPLRPFFPHLALALLVETKSLWFHCHRNQSGQEKNKPNNKPKHNLKICLQKRSGRCVRLCRDSHPSGAAQQPHTTLPCTHTQQRTVQTAEANQNIFRELTVWRIIQAIKSHMNTRPVSCILSIHRKTSFWRGLLFK